MPDYKYTYCQFDGEIKINTNFGIDFSEIQQNTIEHSSERIIQESIYPNGFAIKFEQEADSIIIHTNKELIAETDGSYSIKLD
ncbi:hypothetical protein ACRS8Y_01830 [Bacillus paranthracis]|uniref:hypothetical protein n=1 Tax=Bacillus paranthracis TaxID=2026186 RepID=UPI003EE33E39|nr:hypothetical protein [Bacillus cereus]